MSKQLIFVSGVPNSGRTTWVNKIYNGEGIKVVDASSYPSLYVEGKLLNDTIEKSRLWCLEQVRELMTQTETQTNTIVLCLIACRPDRWREFIQLAIDNEYNTSFKFPTNKLLFYTTKHSNSMEQQKFIELSVITKYPRDTKQVKRGLKETIEVETNESALLKYIITELQTAQAFYYSNKLMFDDKSKLLNLINTQYKNVILSESKKEQKKIEKEAKKEAKREAQEAEEAEEKVKQVMEETSQCVESNEQTEQIANEVQA